MMEHASLTRRVRPALRWLPALAWAGLIFYLSSQPEPLGQQPGDSLGLVAHTTVFGVLAALVLLAAGGPARADRRAYLIAFLVASLYGVSDELHQAFVPGRSPDPRDWVADTAGAAAALAGLALLWRWGRLPGSGGGRRGARGGHHDVAE